MITHVARSFFQGCFGEGSSNRKIQGFRAKVVDFFQMVGEKVVPPRYIFFFLTFFYLLFYLSYKINLVYFNNDP